MQVSCFTGVIGVEEISVPKIHWSCEQDYVYGVERHVPTIAGQHVDLEIRQITRCSIDAATGRVTEERQQWSIITEDGHHIGRSFGRLDDARKNAACEVVALWMRQADEIARAA